MINWKRIDLACKTADLVAMDRRLHGRNEGSAGTLRKRYEDMTKQILKAINTLNRMLSNAGF